MADYFGQGGTNFSDGSIGNGGTVDHYLTSSAGTWALIRCTVANLPTGKAGYAVGCIAEASDSGALYTNTGTITSAIWTTYTSAGSPSAYSLGLSSVYAMASGTTLTLTAFSAPSKITTGNIGEATLAGVTPIFGTGSNTGTTGLTAALANALTLYTTLKALSGTAIPTPSAIESDNYGYGAGVFAPGVYTTASAIGMTASKTITLSGVGDYVFVSTGGAITFGATDVIQLTNGAVASRVFWVANNAITTGASDTLKGNFMSGAAGAITIGAINNIEGRLISPVAITVDGTTTNIYLPTA